MQAVPEFLWCAGEETGHDEKFGGDFDFEFAARQTHGAGGIVGRVTELPFLLEIAILHAVDPVFDLNGVFRAEFQALEAAAENFVEFRTGEEVGGFEIADGFAEEIGVGIVGMFGDSIRVMDGLQPNWSPRAAR